MEKKIRGTPRINELIGNGARIIFSTDKINNNIKSEPSVEAALDGVDYKIWPIINEAIIKEFVNGMRNKTLVIADGHHRYKTALKYEKNHDGLDSKEVMVTLVNSKNPGMQIMPTHRIIRGIELSITDIKKEVGHFFSYNEFHGAEKLLIEMDKADSQKNILGLYHRSSNTGLLLKFEAFDLLKSKMSDQSRELRELDTNILHSFLFKEVFNIDTNRQEDLNYLSYLRGNKSAIKMLDKEEDYDIVCFVNPPSLDDVFNIAEGGETMPQKSTYFYPKVYSGLVTRCFNK